MGDSFDQVLAKLPVWAHWLFTTPPWVPSMLAIFMAGFLVWLGWPREAAGDDNRLRSALAPPIPPIIAAVGSGGNADIVGTGTAIAGHGAIVPQGFQASAGGSARVEGVGMAIGGGAGGIHPGQSGFNRLFELGLADAHHHILFLIRNIETEYVSKHVSEQDDFRTGNKQVPTEHINEKLKELNIGWQLLDRQDGGNELRKVALAHPNGEKIATGRKYTQEEASELKGSLRELYNFMNKEMEAIVSFYATPAYAFSHDLVAIAIQEGVPAARDVIRASRKAIITASPMYHTIINKNPYFTKDLAEVVGTESHMGDINGAVTKYMNFLDHLPENSSPEMIRMSCADYQNEFEAAINRFRKWIAEFNTRAGVLRGELDQVL